jgi:hypothetical protein
MTFHEYAIQYLTNNGMFDDQASAVVGMAKTHSLFTEFGERRFSDNTSDYPQPMMSVFLVSLNRVAVEWIDANCPNAWFRGVFAEDAVSSTP